jgi:hypothetical protein
VIGAVIEEATREGEVAGLIATNRVPHEFCAKNVVTYNFDADERVGPSLIK